MNAESAVAAELNPPVRILLGPGPSDIHPRVLEALGKGTVGHLDPYYLEIMNDMQRMLQALFRTKNPMTLAISGTGSAGMETLEAVKRIKQELPDVKTILGVSNISFGLDAYPRRVLNSVFMHEAVDNGLDMAIVNYTKIYPLYKIPQEEVELVRKLIHRDTSNGDPLQVYMNHFAGLKGKPQASTTAHVETLSIEDKLKFAIINGEKSVGDGAHKQSLDQLLDDREHRIADPLGRFLELGHVDFVGLAMTHDLVGGFLRDDPEPGLRAGERGLEIEIFLHAVLVREYGPHRRRGENVAEHRGIEDRGGHSGLLRACRRAR